MSAYLIDNPPARSQFRRPRRARPTGLIVVHTAENVLDTVGPDTGAEGVARFIRDRDTPGSYHDLVDSDSCINVCPYDSEAFQDGTGSNSYALSISFALSAKHWPDLTADRRDAYLAQGVVAFRRQQEWLRANGHPLTSLRRVTRAQSDGGASGFISHGDRDPARRSDPGAGFPWALFIQMCADTTTPPEEDTLPSAADVWSQPVEKPDRTQQPAYAVLAAAADSAAGANSKLDAVLALLGQDAAATARLEAAVSAGAKEAGADVDVDALARAIVVELGRTA